jgi:hypothetical protein
MAPLQTVGIPHQPFAPPIWTSSRDHFDSGTTHGQRGRFLDVVRCNYPLADHIETRIPETKQRKKRLSFADSVEFREIRDLTDFSSEDIMATWWSANEYVVIRRMIAITVREIMNGSSFEANDEVFCERGLEIRTKAGAAARSMTKRRAILTVLRAQDFQRQEGFNDPEYIAEIYAECTKASSDESYSSGITDEKAARRL